MAEAKYVHTNIVARDWRKLAGFYEQIFGCAPVPPERNLTEKWVEDCTGLAGAEIRGIHLRLPGWGAAGPTLEIFGYNHEEKRPATAINRPGLTHIAFAVDDVSAARDAVLEAGGRAIGKLVSVNIPQKGHIEFIYVTDPEGNIIELQRWSD
ncbi:MAG: VOC family protein [Deltaproteobacteria bacterium]|nr:VOC family protein [Deltaproteobacteria bacterium]